MSTLKVNNITDLGNEYPGSLAYPGQVLQVVSQTLTDQLAINSLTGTEIMSASITPSSINSKILVTLSIDMVHADYYTGFVQINRNGTNISPSSTRPHRFFIGIRSAQGGFASSTATTYTPETMTKSYLDSPGSSSLLTYSVIAAVPQALTDGYDVPLYINRASNNTNDTVNNSGFTTLTLMEVAG